LLEQFKRLVNIGVRMNDCASRRFEFILNQLVELSGAERVFLGLLDETSKHIVAARMASKTGGCH
jgi:hypothetical protein